MVERVGAVLRRHQGRELIITDIKFAEQITIYHVPVSFLFRPAENQQGRSIAPTASDSMRTERETIPVPRFPSAPLHERSVDASHCDVKNKRHSSTQGAQEYKLLL